MVMIARAARAAVEQYEKEQREEDSNGAKVEAEVEESNSEGMVPNEHKDYESLTVVQLKDILRTRGLEVSGRKAEIIERLKS